MPVLVLADAVRHVLKQPLMDLRQTGRAKKDAQRTVAYVSVKEVANGKDYSRKACCKSEGN